MSQNNSGEKSLLEKKIDKITELLDSYKEDLGLSTFTPDSRIQDYLSMTAQDFESKTKSECLSICLMLERHCLYTDIERNQHQSYLNWANRELDNIAAKHAEVVCPDLRYIKWDFVKSKVVSQNAYADALDRMIKEAQIRCDFLYGLAKRVEAIANTVRQIAFSKGDR